jgi:putative flippase GtrA
MRKNWIHNPTLWQTVRFGVVGVMATAFHYALYYLLLPWLGSNIAYAAGYLLSFVANFYLTAYFTFHSAPSWRKLVGMGGAHGVNFVLHLVLLNVFLWLGVGERWAPLPVFAIAIPVNFILVRWVFTPKKQNIS